MSDLPKDESQDNAPVSPEITTVGSLAEYVDEYLQANHVLPESDSIVFTIDNDEIKGKDLIQIGRELQPEVEPDKVVRPFMYISNFTPTTESMALVVYLKSRLPFTNQAVKITSSLEELASWIQNP